MNLLLLGLSHRTAPLELRERVVYPPDEAAAALRDLKVRGAAPQSLLISTCNRTELYALTANGCSPAELADAIFIRRVGEEHRADTSWLYRREGRGAVEHLFRVACGLDSMVLGEQQILGQVKTAYEVSRKAETAGTVLHRLANRAFRVGKRARSETRIGEGAVSVAYAAVELAEKVFHDLEGRGVLVVGAGENARLCVEHLLGRKCAPLFIANRTRSHAEELAREFGGEILDLDHLGEAMVHADIVVSTTGSPDPVVREDAVRRAMRERGNKPLILIDIAVPHDIDPAVDAVANVFRFDMDALDDIIERSRRRREREVPTVEELIDHEIDVFMKWLGNLAAGPMIKDLHHAFEDVRREEMERYAGRFGPEHREKLDTFTRNLVRKLLRGVTMEIKGYRLDNPEQADRLATLRALFGLEESESKEEEGGDLE